MSLTFRQLVNGNYIGTCQAMLPNGRQCYKGSVYEVTDDSTKPPRVAQYCLGHARIEEAKAKGTYVESQPASTTFTVETLMKSEPQEKPEPIVETPTASEPVAEVSTQTEQKEEPKKPEPVKDVKNVNASNTISTTKPV